MIIIYKGGKNMAQIMNVDYEAMPNQAKQMRQYAIELNNEFKTAYSYIGDMHNSWYGVRYNELVRDFNNLAPRSKCALTKMGKKSSSDKGDFFSMASNALNNPSYSPNMVCLFNSNPSVSVEKSSSEREPNRIERAIAIFDSAKG